MNPTLKNFLDEHVAQINDQLGHTDIGSPFFVTAELENNIFTIRVNSVSAMTAPKFSTTGSSLGMEHDWTNALVMFRLSNTLVARPIDPKQAADISLAISCLISLIFSIPAHFLAERTYGGPMVYAPDVSHVEENYDSLRVTIDHYTSFMRGMWAQMSRVESGIVLESPEIDPTKYLNRVFDTVAPADEIDLGDLDGGDLAYGYSGGKESTLMKHIWDRFNIDALPIGILDGYQFSDREMSFENAQPHEKILLGGFQVVPMSRYREFMKLVSPVGAPPARISVGTMQPFVAVQRIALILQSLFENKRFVAFGDEAERQQIHRDTKTGRIFYSHEWFQTQMHYKFLNQMFSTIQTFTPLGNVNQVQILNWVYRKGLPITSCWTMNHDWCNECGKCHRVAALFHEFYRADLMDDAERDLAPFKSLAITHPVKLLATMQVHDWAGLFSLDTYLQNGFDYSHFKPMFPELEKAIGRMLLDVNDMTPYVHPITKVWTDESLDKIMRFMAK